MQFLWHLWFFSDINQHLLHVNCQWRINLLLRILLLLWMMKPLVTISKRWWRVSGCFSEKAKCFLWVCGSTLWLLSKIKKKLLDKLKEIFSERKVDKAKTQFLWFNGTNSMSGSKAGLRRFQSKPPFLLTLTADVTVYYFVLNIYKTAASLVAKDWSVLLGLRMLFYCS